MVIISRVIDIRVLKIIRYCRSTSTGVFFFLDDHVLAFPSNYYITADQFYERNRRLIECILDSVDGLIVSTDKMLDVYRCFNKNIWVTPPCVDKKFLTFSRPSARPRTTFTIGYAGSLGHKEDFKFLENALLHIYEKYSPNIALEFMGCIPESLSGLVDGERVRFQPFDTDYKKYLELLRGMEWDIALCPILDSFYTGHKSNIKLIEYSACRKAGIYSDISLYNRDIRDGFNGFLAANIAEKWIEKIEFAFSHKDALRSIGERAHDYVREHYSSGRSALEWHNLLNSLKKVPPKPGKALYAKEVLLTIKDNLYCCVNKFKAASPRFDPNAVRESVLRLGAEFKRNTLYRLRRQKIGVAMSKIPRPPGSNPRSRKEVLFLIPWMTVGGGDKVNLELARSLGKRGYGLHFITTEPSPNEWSEKFRAITANVYHLPDLAVRNEFHVFILEYIRRTGINLVVISNSGVGYEALPIIRQQLPHLKVVDILHGQGGAREGGGFPHFSFPYEHFIDKRIVVTSYLKNYMIGNYRLEPKKIRVIHNGIDPSAFIVSNPEAYKARFGCHGGKFIVSYIGRLAFEKHPERIVELAKEMRSSSPGLFEKIEFLIAGHGPMHDSLKESINSYGLEGKVHLLGNINDVPNLVSASRLVLLVSEIEGLPMVILEAMALGVPVISTNVGGVPEIIADGINGILVANDDTLVRQLSEHVKRLILDQDLYSEIQSRVCDEVKNNFSLNKMMDGYDEVFSSLLTGKH